MKAISCGVIYHNGTSLLIGHSTGSRWDIPKGHLEYGETYVQCAIRELFEETNLVAHDNELVPLGKHYYLPKKDLVLFELKKELPPISDLKCNATITLPSGKTIYEFDEFSYILFDEIYNYLHPSLVKIIEKTILGE